MSVGVDDQMGPAPMDVDAAYNSWKGGGKDRGKGGSGNGKGGCFICGRPGHRAENCRLKGKGKGDGSKGKGRGGAAAGPKT
eukprot:701239-Pyramimonas_sp.AAC.1